VFGRQDQAKQPATRHGDSCRRPDPRMLHDLHSQGVAHLAVRVRDGTGLVGPLVVPGVTSCLGNH
jgi:hypothetical protein